MGTLRQELVGKIFGQLKVVEEIDRIANNRFFLCSCSCGGERKASYSNLTKDINPSCGCVLNNLPFTPPQIKHRTRQAWITMKLICSDPTHPEWLLVGRKGIKVCPTWLNSLKTFKQDMGSCPSRAHKLIRLDPNLNYSPDNCIWYKT